MWPFSDEEEAQTDLILDEFNGIASAIYEQAPDVDSGLSALADLYSETSFSDEAPGTDSFLEYSTKVREKFGDNRPTDYQTTLELAPINYDDIEVDSEDEEEAKLLRINRWEEENLNALSQVSDPRQLQARDQLSRGIKQYATAQRREYYGSDNYLITDLGLRFTQGAVGPLASLLGADSVNEFFEEQTDPDGADVFGYKVGGDEGYSTAFASGAGSVIGAVGSGLATGSPAGTIAYLGASGAGSVREAYNKAKEAGASDEQALEAAGIETSSQAIQLLAGSKVFGDVVKRVGGKAVTGLGTRVFPRVVGAGAIEGSSEGVGQVISNIGENVGQGEDYDKDIGRGVLRSTIVGAGLGSAAAGGGEYYAIRQSRKTQVDPITGIPLETTEGEILATTQDDSEFLTNAPSGGIDPGTLEPNDLKQTLEDIDGAPPPKPESIPIPGKKVTLSLDSEIETVGRMKDGSEVILADGRLHIKSGDNIQEAFDTSVYVSKETAEMLKALKEVPNDDGTAVTFVSEKGKMYIEFSKAADPDGKLYEIPTEEPKEDSYLLQGNTSRTPNGVRQHKFSISEAGLDSAGAAKAGFGNQKESGYIKRLRAKYGPEISEQLNLSVEQGLEDADGNITYQEIPLHTYFKKTPEDRYNPALTFVNEKGIYGSLDYLNSLDRYNADDQRIANILNVMLEDTFLSVPETDVTNKALANDLYQEFIAVNEKVGKQFGEGLGERNFRGIDTAKGFTPGDIAVLGIKAKLRDQALKSVEQELGEKVDYLQTVAEVKNAETEVDAVKKDIARETEGQQTPEGQAPKISPEKKKRLTEAQKKENRAKARLQKIQEKLEEETKAFSEEDQNNLKTLTNLIQQANKGTTDFQDLNNRITDIKSKYVTDGKELFNLTDYWKRNILSGWSTTLNNMGGNIVTQLGTQGAVAITGAPGEALASLKGALRGLGIGANEAGLILKGERGGRLALGKDSKFKPNQYTWWNFINETAMRGMSAGDSLSARTAYESSLDLAANVVAKKAGIPKAKRQAWVDEKLFRTEENHAEAVKAVDERIAALKDAGIERSDAQRKMMIYEYMQERQDATISEMAKRNSLMSTYLQDPEWTLGALNDVVEFLTKRFEFNVKGVKIAPFGVVLPFTRTASNVVNEMINYTPLGFSRAAYMHFFDNTIPLEGGKRKGFSKEKVKVEVGKDAEGNPIMGEVSNELEIRATLGKAIIGSSMVGVMTGLTLLAHELAEKERKEGNPNAKPFLDFYGSDDYENANSMRIGGSYFKLGNTPLALLPSMISSIVNGSKKGADLDVMAANAVMGSLKSMTDLSFIKSITQLTESFSDIASSMKEGSDWSLSASVENAVKSQAASALSGFIPSVGFLRNAGKWYQQSPIETYNNFRAKMANNIPFADKVVDGLTVRLNIFGEPIKYDLSNKLGAGRFYSYEINDPVTTWMSETGYDISRPPPIVKLTKAEQESAMAKEHFKQTGYTNQLTPWQSRKVLEISGPLIKAKLQEYMNNPSFNTFSEANQKRINEWVSHYRAQAKFQVLSGQFNDDPDSDVDKEGKLKVDY